jgi:inositol 1,4,5-triphosphate receptor type 1
VVYREETLHNVIRCVTKNAKSVLLTAVFAVIIIYLFSICGFLFFRDDFVIEIEPKFVKSLIDEEANLGEDIGSHFWILFFLFYLWNLVGYFRKRTVM